MSLSSRTAQRGINGPFWLVSLVLWFGGRCFGAQLVTCPLLNQPAAVQADLYGSGVRGVLLAHGGRFHKESWKKQAEVLASSGFLVLAIAFRGDNFNSDGSPGSSGGTVENAADVVAGLACLRRAGASSIFAVGASMGGDAVGEVNAQSAPGTISRSVFLGSSGGDNPAKLTGRKLFLVARDDRSGSGLRLHEISAHYTQAPQPKQLLIVAGSAHAQFLFGTAEGTRVLNEIVGFLTAP